MHRHFRVVLLSLVLLATALTGAWAAPPSDSEITHLLNRLGYGPRPGDVEHVRQIGIPRYVQEQLHPERMSDADVEQRLTAFRTLGMSPLQLVLAYPNNNLVKNLEKQSGNGNQRAKQALDMMPPADQRGKPRQILLELGSQKLVRAVHSKRQLQEVMVDFWMNHFNVYWLKGADRVLLTGYERDVIRPNAMGKFRDLLAATAHSPAMLFYLDNWLSTAENTPQRKNAKRKAGLNENYAREIMELHTLGVDGGYSQKDVVEVARCFTGWTLDQPRRGGAFVFRPRMHDNGQKVVLGHVIPAGGGEKDAQQVIDILARHPRTARFVALKLCRRFVADDPPKALVDRVASVYLKTDGDIRSMLSAIFASPEFASSARAKVKTPYELVVSSIRAVDGDTSGGVTVLQALNRMGMAPYMCQPPTGYADRADAWVSTGGLLERMNFEVALMSGRMTGTDPHADRLLADLPADPQAYVDVLARRLLGSNVSKSTLDTLHKSATESKARGEALQKQLVALILGSPEFQRR